MRRGRLFGYAIAVALMTPLAASAGQRQNTGPLRVCADPNNLPYSNRAGEGFENKIAAMLAQDLGKPVSYTWERGGAHFLDHTLLAGKCDVVMETPVGLAGIATTRPYYASRYVFVSRKTSNLNLTSMRDPRLKTLRIAVHLLGDAETPPAEALSRQGISDNVAGYLIHGDAAKPNPPGQIIEAVAGGTADIAAVWGPLGGYFAQRSSVPLVVQPITNTQSFSGIPFTYAIAMGVRRQDAKLRDALDGDIAAHRAQIRNLLLRYGIPLVPVSGE